MIKTTHRHFPKKFLQDVEITERGGHFIVVSSEDGVSLRSMAWNDGKKDSKTKKNRKQKIRKQIVDTCGTTLPGRAHRKRRWRLDTAGHESTYFKSIPRPAIVEDYFDSAQKNDVHNHRPQGPLGVCLESHTTQRWD